jgi:hypothetical protein
MLPNLEVEFISSYSACRHRGLSLHDMQLLPDECRGTYLVGKQRFLSNHIRIIVHTPIAVNQTVGAPIPVIPLANAWVWPLEGWDFGL